MTAGESEISKIFREYEEAMDDWFAKHPPPKCHFRYMEGQADDFEEWFECSVCGHTKKIGPTPYGAGEH